jgi:hypothetical protein
MTICGGPEVDAPHRAWSAAKLAGMPQQIEIRAVHEVAAAAAQTNGAAAQFVGLPSTSRRNGVGPEQNFGDLAVRAAFKPAVEAAEHQSEPAALLRGQGVRRPIGGAARQGGEQAP